VLLAVLLAGGSSRAMLASARLSCLFISLRVRFLNNKVRECENNVGLYTTRYPRLCCIYSALNPHLNNIFQSFDYFVRVKF